MKQNKSIIDRYFDYMRDSWCEEECRTIFGTRAASVWKCGAEVLHLTCAVQPDDSISLSIGAIGGC